MGLMLVVHYLLWQIYCVGGEDMVQLINRRVWFNGTTSVVTGTDLDIAGSFTIGCRFKTDKLKDTYQSLIAKEAGGTGTNLNYQLRIQNTNVMMGQFGNGAAGFLVVGNTKVTDGVWHQGVCVYDITGQLIKLYLDGVQDAVPVATGGAAPFNNNAPVELGNWAGLRFNGYMADAFIYNRALSEAEIAYNYRHPNNPIRRGLQVSYTQDSIDRPAAGTWQDRSGNARNGTITNATTSKYPCIPAGRNALFFPTAAGSDRVDCGNGASLNPALTGLISTDFWVKNGKDVITNYAIMGEKRAAGLGWSSYWDKVNKNLQFVSDAGVAVQSVVLPDYLDGTWKHVVFTHTAGAATGEVYVNGVNKTSSRAVQALSNSGNNLYLGNNATFIIAPVGGYIASARIYNRILSAAEVAYNHEHPNCPIRRGIVLNLSQESLYGSLWQDLSGNANNGTITGAQVKNLGQVDGR